MNDVTTWMTSTESRAAYVARARREFNPDTEWTPISDYEPCEVCGNHVVGMRLQRRREVVELIGVRHGRAVAPVMRVRRHHCPGRAT